jgi:beta-galactosidase/beta-glucuronidase
MQDASGHRGAHAPAPRPEYPRPQFARADWLCLNGRWQFEIDQSDSGLERGLVRRELDGEILVPFAPESELSGVGATDFLEAVWYRRTAQVPLEWAGRRTLLHFQAVDHDATVWIDGVEAGRHRGGFTGFSIDVTELTEPGRPFTITVRARDTRHGSQARGKQSTRFDTYEAFYRRSSGIWQSVWLEPVPEVHLRRAKITPDLPGGRFLVRLPVSRTAAGYRVRAVLSDAQGEAVSAEAGIEYDTAPVLVLPVVSERRRVWSPADPHLYTLRFELVDAHGALVDEVASYAGLRSVSIDGQAVLLNGERVFQRLVLDQGWYPNGLMTAPDDLDLIADIELSQQAGFNGARLHQKVFEERFLYHADRLGYLVWGEFADWGSRVGEDETAELGPTPSFVAQWLEVAERDYSHPAIIGWCPLNETGQTIYDRITVLDDATRAMFLATKAIDQTRPVIDASGWSHRVPEADVYDSHNYEQDPAQFAIMMSGLAHGAPYTNLGTVPPWSVPYRGQPYLCSEFGGIWWNPTAAVDEESWGYGDRPGSPEEFLARFEGLVSVLLEDENMFGYCYTQLTDVYQEQNGLYYFDRAPKFDVSRIRAIQARPAAIESKR